MTAKAPAPTILHGSCVAHIGRGLLILGPSGAGKSGLALRMIALGAVLVADDRTEITEHPGGILARCPRPELRGVIEARGIGLLHAPFLDAVELALVIDLGREETERLPPHRRFLLLGHALPLVLRPQNHHLAESLLLYLAGGRHDPEP